MSQFAQYLSTFKIFTKSCKSVHKFVFNALVLPSWLGAKFPYETDIDDDGGGGGGGVYIECGVIFHYFEITSARETAEVGWCSWKEGKRKQISPCCC